MRGLHYFQASGKVKGGVDELTATSGMQERNSQGTCEVFFEEAKRIVWLGFVQIVLYAPSDVVQLPWSFWRADRSWTCCKVRLKAASSESPSEDAEEPDDD